MNRAMWLSETLEEAHNGMAKVWIWMFTVVVMALFAVVFSELHAMGRISTEAANALATQLSLVVGMAAVGFATYAASMLFGLVAWWIGERESA